MKKIPSVFKRNYDGDWLVRDEVVEGSEWVLEGEGTATLKWDGTSCLVRDGKLYRRYDRKVTKKARRRGAPYSNEDCKPAPENWEACEEKCNEHTGHWPGWVPVTDKPEDKHFKTALEEFNHPLADGTYELIGPKVQGNPHNLRVHIFERHGGATFYCEEKEGDKRTFESISESLMSRPFAEGIVYHHPDGRMAKIKRRDFGFDWPVKE